MKKLVVLALVLAILTPTSAFGDVLASSKGSALVEPSGNWARWTEDITLRRSALVMTVRIRVKRPFPTATKAVVTYGDFAPVAITIPANTNGWVAVNLPDGERPGGSYDVVRVDPEGNCRFYGGDRAGYDIDYELLGYWR